uniref:Uncharacterized protein n=1 Tax=Strigamia maritima TaxID=126957 RepID=T1IYJ2_STRMM
MKQSQLLIVVCFIAMLSIVTAFPNRGGGEYPTGGYTMGSNSGSLFKIPPIKFPTLPIPSFFVSFPPVHDDYGGYRRRFLGFIIKSNHHLAF